jgi:hypothetical protein
MPLNCCDVSLDPTGEIRLPAQSATGLTEVKRRVLAMLADAARGSSPPDKVGAFDLRYARWPS